MIIMPLSDSAPVLHDPTAATETHTADPAHTIQPRPEALQNVEPEAGPHAAYLRVIEERFGFRLAPHQVTRLREVVQALLTSTGCAGPAELLGVLTNQRPDLLDTLAAALTVGETHFFRVTPQIQVLREVVLPELLRRRAEQRRLRLWSAGCSTGEEPYTLAILLHELLPAPHTWDIQILATDINTPSLEVARQGYFGEWSFRGTSDDVRQRYFTPEGKGWRLREQVRRAVQFASHNLVGDTLLLPGWEEADLDLIVCRNVTIYFSPVATQRLYRRFALILAPDGWLVLGPSDPIPTGPEDQADRRDGSPFEAVSLPGAVLWRRATASPLAPAAASTLRPRTSAAVLDTIVRPAAPAPALATIPASKPAPRRWQHTPVAATDTTTELAAAWKLVQDGARSAAREQALRLARSWPLEPDVHLLLGMLYLDEGALDPAVESLRRATFLDKDNAMAHFSLGRAYQQQGHAARARGAFAHARRLLAAMRTDQALAHGGGLVAGELCQAVDAQLASLRTHGTGTPARNGA